MNLKRKVSVFADGDSVKAANDWPIACTVELTVSGQGIMLADNRQLKSLHILPPYAAGELDWVVSPSLSHVLLFSDLELARVLRQGPGASWTCDFRGAFGSPENVHNDEIRYEWPFSGQAVCGQTFGGDPAPNLYHSVEFLTSHGSPVLASRRGTVFICASDAKLGNFVKVSHVDGSVATYSGLTKALVDEGQVVQEGMQIGTSGPVVRFTLQLPNGAPGLPPSIPFVFNNGSPAGCVPVLNQSYGGTVAAPRSPGPVKNPMKQPMKQKVAKQAGPKKGPTGGGSGVFVPPPPAKQASFGGGADSGGASPYPPPPPARGGQPPVAAQPTPPPPPQRMNSSSGVPQQQPAHGSSSWAPQPDAEWNGTYASPKLLPVKPKPPAVNRAEKPQLSRGSSGPSPAGGMPPPYQTVDPHANYGNAAAVAPPPPPPGVNPSMMPGHRAAPPSRALHPELYEEKPYQQVTPEGPPVHASMQPGYQRETDFMEETKRTLDIRRHNPVKNTKKKIAVATPSTRDLKNDLRKFF